MDFNKIRLIGLSTVNLPIHNTRPSDSFILKAADGFGPPESAVAIAKTLEQGGTYLGRQTQTREIVLRVGLNANYKLNQTPTSLRETLYGLLTPTETDAIKVQFLKNDTVVAVTVGHVSRIEIVPFTKTPEVQIVIPCVESFLNGPEEIVHNTGSKNPFIVSNVGSAQTGFAMELIFTASPTGFILIGPSNWRMFLDYPFVTGDVLAFDTRPGKRFITRRRGGNEINLIHTLSRDSKWLILRGGDNIFAPSTGAWSWGFVKYTPQYWGI